MKIVWHIFKKDLRRLGLPLSLWGIVIVAQYVVWHLDRDADWHRNGRSLSPESILWLLHLLAGWLIVPLLIHDDPLIGDLAGWRVRPISGGRLLAAKLFGMAMMLWLWPSVLTIPWCAELGFGPAEIARAVAVNALGMAVFTAVPLLVAVLTESFVRFVMWSIVATVAIGLGALVIVAEMPAKGTGNINGSILITRAALAGGATLLAAGIVVPMQFLRRRTVWARGLVGVAAAMAALVVQAWPWSAAQMLAHTGWQRYSLPTVTATVGNATLSVPADPARRAAEVQVETEFAIKGVSRGDTPVWSMVEPKWSVGGRIVAEPAPFGAGNRAVLGSATKILVQGSDWPRDGKDAARWDMALDGRLGTRVRNGEVAIEARHTGAVWRSTPGPRVPVRAGAWAGRGLDLLHVSGVGDVLNYGNRGYPSVAWVQTEPLFTPEVMLELINPDGMGGRRFATAALIQGKNVWQDGSPDGSWSSSEALLPHGRIPVGVMSVMRLRSTFDRNWWNEDRPTEEVRFEAATLTYVRFQEAAPMEATVARTALVPDMIVEGRLEDALRRAKAEGKLVYARVWSPLGEDKSERYGPDWFFWPKVRELAVARFVCVHLTAAEAGKLLKSTDEPGAPVIVILNSDGGELDRLRDLGPVELEMALRANLSGKTYAAVLTEALAAGKEDDRRLRLQLHEALRARGELTGAFDAIMWMVEHPSAPFEGTEIFGVGQRLQRFAQAFAAVRTSLLERREKAVGDLRRDPRDVGAARLLFAITLGLRNDERVWGEFPRLMPHENPSWWDYMRTWIGTSLSDRQVASRHKDVAAAVDLEKFFADGPAWVRTQLLQRRGLTPGGPPAKVGDWQRQLVKVGANCVETLAATGQTDAALRVALAVLKVDGSSNTRQWLQGVLMNNGAKAQAKALWAQGIYGR